MPKVQPYSLHRSKNPTTQALFGEYSKNKPKKITLEAVELFVTVFELPASLIGPLGNCFRFDDLSDTFKKVDTYEDTNTEDQ